jgi:hypothetical protein
MDSLFRDQNRAILSFYPLPSALQKSSFLQTGNRFLENGYPAWIRTKNNASKGRCVTVTPRGKIGWSIYDFRRHSGSCNWWDEEPTHADEISSPLNTQKTRKSTEGKSLQAQQSVALPREVPGHVRG